VVPMAPPAFIGLAFTSSYVRALAPDALQRFRVDLEELVAEHAPPSELIEIPYVVDCETARRRAP
jgi:hypothetical protein